MKNIGRLFLMCLMLGLFLTACKNTKSEDNVEVTNTEKEKVNEEVNKVETTDHGYEIAMASYQCPMKCEGETSYKEEGTCPKCKMDLKKIEEKPEEVDEDHTYEE